MALEIVKVESVRQAAAVLAAEAGARMLGGGTLVVRDVNYGAGAIDKLVLADNLGLGTITATNGVVTLGAAVTMAKVAAHRDLAFLADVAGSIGGPPVRAMATVGGNLFAPYPFGDFAVALIALNATVIVEALDGEKKTAVETFLSELDRHRNAIVKAVSFAIPAPGSFRFAKIVRRKPHGASVLSIAAVLPPSGGASVAFGAMGPVPIRARGVEKALAGKPLDAAAIDAAVKVATEGCAPLTDPQASEWYRMAVLPVHLRRLLSGEESGEA